MVRSTEETGTTERQADHSPTYISFHPVCTHRVGDDPETGSMTQCDRCMAGTPHGGPGNDLDGPRAPSQEAV